MGTTYSRLAFALALTAGLAALSAPAAVGQVAPQCAGGLGVARTVEIDTQGGTRFGHQQYKDADFLAPGEVVLTFDDGPLRTHTQKVVSALAAHCTKATFFVVGSMALADPDMLREIARQGHTIGTHTWSHNYHLRSANAQRYTHEIEMGFSAVQIALGRPVAPFFRFPFLSDGRGPLEHLAARKISTFSIDVDSLDYRLRGAGGAEAVIRRVMRELAEKKKGILLFHDIQPSTAAAMPRLLDELKAKGFRIVHLTSKSTATTLPEFDRLAEAEARRRKIAIDAQPLAPRAVTWPLPRPTPSVQPASAKGVPPAPPVTVVGGGATSANRTPGVEVDTTAPPLAPSGAQPKPRLPAEEDWRRRVLGQ